METPDRPTAPAPDVLVVGGGLAGLTAATFLGRAGLRVVLLEAGSEPGGRARTTERDGFQLNLGPHALYRTGVGASVLAELGVPVPGGDPPAEGLLTEHGREGPIPATPLALLRHPGFTLRERLEALRFFTAAGRGPLPASDLSFDSWLEARQTPEAVARLARAFVRLSTYTAETDLLSAEAAVLQLRQALGGVRYVEGGWGRIVSGLVRRAREAGVRIRTRCAARSVASSPAGISVTLADGAACTARMAVLTVPPRHARALLGSAAGGELRRVVESARPVLASCLDIGLRRLPRPEVILALDLRGPRYLSCHSLAPGLAPADQVLLQLAHYGSDEGDARTALEDWLDGLQPGWREETVMQRWLPAARVCEMLPEASWGGLRGRPAVDDSGVPGVFLAGDWVGAEGLLSDASFASARSVAHQLAQRLLLESA